MNENLYNDALNIAQYSINEVLPNKAVVKALQSFKMPKGKVYMIAIGKAAYTMALETIKHVNIYKGLVITKYNHAKGQLKNTQIIEAGHPTLDSNSILAANTAIDLVSNLTIDDTVLFLISGGGSSLFEAPLISLDKFKDINNQLLKCGATIEEINTIRKRLSKVKGGKFGELCKPAHIYNIILSDIINDPIDMIASGPTVVDKSSSKDALEIVKKYNLKIDEEILSLLNFDGVKDLENVETYVSLNNNDFKNAAKEKLQSLNYNVKEINEPLTRDINEAVMLFKEHLNDLKENEAILASGEIVLNIVGNGLGGRNQELALRLGLLLQDKNTAAMCIGSDGTDGPTDAAGAYVDKDLIHDDINGYLDNNDSYNYLSKYGGLIKTGPTGTNVCDLYLIIKKA